MIVFWEKDILGVFPKYYRRKEKIKLKLKLANDSSGLKSMKLEDNW